MALEKFHIVQEQRMVMTFLMTEDSKPDEIRRRLSCVLADHICEHVRQYLNGVNDFLEIGGHKYISCQPISYSCLILNKFRYFLDTHCTMFRFFISAANLLTFHLSKSEVLSLDTKDNINCE